MELTENRIFIAKMGEQFVCPESARQILGLNAGLVGLIPATATCGPQWVGFAKRHKFCLEESKRRLSEFEGFLTQLSLPKVKNIQLYCMLERFLARWIFQQRKGVWEAILVTQPLDLDEPRFS